jgi:hypothetical protein
MEEEEEVDEKGNERELRMEVMTSTTTTEDNKSVVGNA